jgi:hypothetical protein
LISPSAAKTRLPPTSSDAPRSATPKIRLCLFILYPPDFAAFAGLFSKLRRGSGRKVYTEASYLRIKSASARNKSLRSGRFPKFVESIWQLLEVLQGPRSLVLAVGLPGAQLHSATNQFMNMYVEVDPGLDKHP